MGFGAKVTSITIVIIVFITITIYRKICDSSERKPNSFDNKTNEKQ